MGKIQEIEKKIDQKRNEIDRDRKRIRKTDRRLDRRWALTASLRKDLENTRERIDKQEKILRDIAKEIDEIEETGGVTPEERPEWERLQQKQDGLADRLDANIRQKERLLSRLDDVISKRKRSSRRKKKAQKELDKDKDAVDRMRKRKKKIRRQQQQNDRPSPHFTWAEFDCNNGVDLPESAKPSVRNLCQRVLEPQHSRFGSVHINSGYRTPDYNRSIGGASNSTHVYVYHNGKGVAADHTCSGGGPGDWFNNTAGKADGRGRYSTFHHADIRNEIGWPDAVWSG